MNLDEYQRSANSTNNIPKGSDEGTLLCLLGIGGKAGALLNTYRVALAAKGQMQRAHAEVAEKLGEVLWYTAAAASAYGYNLSDIARANLERNADRFTSLTAEESWRQLPILDANFPTEERFPRELEFRFEEWLESNTGQRTVRMVLATANPNPFTKSSPPGRGFVVGAQIGDKLTDNNHHPDAYRFHDAIHLGFLAVLGWSPNLRSLLRLKRKSDARVDECEDGARAIFAEEGLAAVLSRLARRRDGFLDIASIDAQVIEVARAATEELEVSGAPGWLWARAINQGFTAMNQLASAHGGILSLDLDKRTLSYRGDELAGSNRKKVDTFDER